MAIIVMSELESDRAEGHLKIKLEGWLAISLAMVTLYARTAAALCRQERSGLPVFD